MNKITVGTIATRAVAALVTLAVVVVLVTTPSAAQDRTSYDYDRALTLTSLGTWPLERLQPVTVVLDRVERYAGGMTWWLWIRSIQNWAADSSQPGRCCVLSLTPEQVYLVDANGRRYDGTFGTTVRHVVPPGARLALIVNFRSVPAGSATFVLHLEGGVGLASEPAVSDQPPSANAPLTEQTRRFLAALAPSEHGVWILTDVRLP
jgi:hypothetical protein